MLLKTYIVTIDLLLADFLHEAVDLVLCRHQVVCEDLLVQRTLVADDHSHVATDVAQVSERGGHVSIADDLIVARGHGVVNAAGQKARVGQLVPPADVDDGIGEPHLANLVVDNLFLFPVSLRYYHATRVSISYLIAQPHDTAGRCDGDETTRDEPLDTDFLGRLGQRDLVLLLGGADTADNDFDVGESFNQVLLGRLQVAFADLNPALLQLPDGGFVDRDRANKGDHLLRKTRPRLARSRQS